jgi:hypothetical protein
VQKIIIVWLEFKEGSKPVGRLDLAYSNLSPNKKITPTTINSKFVVTLLNFWEDYYHFVVLSQVNKLSVNYVVPKESVNCSLPSPMTTAK